MAIKVLILEDESSIRSFIKVKLKLQGYDYIEAETGEEALEIFEKESIDIALLDIMLPGINGYEVCRRIREKSQRIGIIMLTAKGQEEDKLEGLAQGADDYMVKPFSPKELIARIESLLRRVNLIVSKEEKEVAFIDNPPFYLDVLNRKLLKENQEIKLTPTEYSIIHLFMSNEGKLFSRDDILDEIWGKDYVGDIKTVDVNIRRLRRKIEEDASNPEYIQTIWGHGYSWRKES